MLERFLLPWPKTVELLGGFSGLPERGLYVQGRHDSRLTAGLAELLTADLRAVGLSPAAESVQEQGGLDIYFRIADERADSEAYKLTADDAVLIEAPSERGLFLGTRTLLQLVRAFEGQPVPKLRIEDYPDYGYRSLMVDVARQPHSIDFHFRMVRRLASLKFNTYHIHFTDNESYTLPSDAYPALNDCPGAYSKQELQQLVALARQYRITIVPEIDLPGHSRALLQHVPGVQCTGTDDGRTVCPGSQQSLKILEQLVGETAALFDGPYFHLGGDEVRLDQVWEHCPHCIERKREQGLGDNRSLYHDFLNRQIAFVKELGLRPVIWECFYVDKAPVIDRDVLVYSWEHHWAQPDELIAAGYDIINASWSPLYAAAPISVTSPEDTARWDPLLFGRGRSPVAPKYWKRIEPSERLKGISMCSWEWDEAAEEPVLFGIGPSGPGQARPAARLPIVAERAWSSAQRSVKDVLEAVGESWWE